MKFKKEFGILLLVFVLFSSCIIEKSTTETYIMRNESSAIINIIPYKFGMADSLSIINLDKGDENKFEINTYKGKNNSPQYIVKYFAQVDSILVIWNNTYKVLHIPDSNSYQGIIKTIDTTTNRNLGSVKKYNLRNEEKKNSNEFLLTYTFSEADYQFAKD